MSLERLIIVIDYMTLLNVLFWVILVLIVIGVFAPITWAHGPLVVSGAFVALFVIIGLKSFRTPIQ